MLLMTSTKSGVSIAPGAMAFTSNAFGGEILGCNLRYAYYTPHTGRIDGYPSNTCRAATDVMFTIAPPRPLSRWLVSDISS